MSSVDNRLNREISTARIGATPQSSVAKAVGAPNKIRGASQTPSSDFASSDTAVVPPSPVLKSPIGSLGRWKIETASPVKPAFTLRADDSTDSKFSFRHHLLLRYAPSLVSLTVHCLVVLLLGVITFTNPDRRGAFLSGVFAEQDVALAGDITTELTASDTNLTPPPEIAMGGGINEALASLSSPLAAVDGNSGARVDVEDVLSGGFGSGAGSGEAAPSLADLQAGKSANFYGLAAQGKRFVFVIDSSTSMWGPRWIEVRKELIRSIRKLEKDQYFFVICFDVTSLSMFGAESIQKDFAPADEENFRKLEYWLSQHTLGPGTRATAALSEALRLKPDAIFLLTDGEFQDNVLQMLRTNNRNKAKKRKTTVNTIGFHSQIGAPVLSQIATENYGQFRYVAPAPNLPMVQPTMRFTGRVYPPQTLEELTPRF